MGFGGADLFKGKNPFAHRRDDSEERDAERSRSIEPADDKTNDEITVVESQSAMEQRMALAEKERREAVKKEELEKREAAKKEEYDKREMARKEEQEKRDKARKEEQIEPADDKTNDEITVV